MKKFPQKVILFLLVLATMHQIECGKINKNNKKKQTPRPVTIRTKLDIKDSDIMHFMQVKSRKDGKPVGILVKKTQVLHKKIREKRDTDDVIEIVGVREPDNEHDRENIYRNAQIINNKLVKKPIISTKWFLAGNNVASGKTLSN